jgi:ketosteroid isomerase-like protein
MLEVDSVVRDFEDLDQVVDQYHRALAAFFTGDPEPTKELYSRADDVSLANPFGPPVRGWSQAAETMTRAATHYRDGTAVGFDRMSEYSTPTLAYIVEMERYAVKIGLSDELAPVTLRVTTIFRPEAGTWKIVHRHADPIASSRPAASVIQQ